MCEQKKWPNKKSIYTKQKQKEKQKKVKNKNNTIYKKKCVVSGNLLLYYLFFPLWRKLTTFISLAFTYSMIYDFQVI